MNPTAPPRRPPWSLQTRLLVGILGAALLVADRRKA